MKLVSAALIAAVLALGAAQVAASSPAKKPPRVVRATIWPNLVITFSPSKFKRGTVVFKVKNRTTAAHEFSINGVTTKSIRPHRTMLVTVTFKKRAVYTATLADCGYLSRCVGGDPDTGPIGNVKVT